MKLNLSHRRTGDRRSGQGLLEFALAIPIFLLLVLGIIEFGRMFLMYTSLFAAAREGARYGAAVDTLCDATGLQDAARRVGFFAGNMNIGVQYDDGYGHLKACEKTVLGDRVHVTTEITFRSITGIIPNINLRSTARRTIIKEVFMDWTIEPPGENPGDIPPAITFGPSGETSTPEETATPEETPTTPLPPLCQGTWIYAENSGVEGKYYYILSFSNDTEKLHTMTQVSISWDTTGQALLTNLDLDTPIPPPGIYWEELWPGDDSDGSFIWTMDPPLLIDTTGEYLLRFEFTKNKNDQIIVIDLIMNDGIDDCLIEYRP
jgi:hypothetical protein